MVKVLFVVGVRPMLLLFVYIISLPTSADAGDEKASESSPARLFRQGLLTEKQLKSIVTIEFNCTGINTKNRTAVDSFYSNVHREILKCLTSTKSTTAATSSTFIATTYSISTTPTADVTTIATTVTTIASVVPVPVHKRKRKKRQQTFDGAVIKEEDLRFLEVDPETDGNGILAMTLLLDVKGRNDGDCGLILLHAVNTTTEDGTLDRVARVSVVAIYRGFPSNRRTIMSENYDHPRHLIWPIVIPIVIVGLVLVIVVGIVIMKKKQVKKLEISGAKRSNLS